MGTFIDSLPVSSADKSKLRQLGADTPFAMLSLIEAAPHEFAQHMGDSAATVREHIEQLVPASDRLRAFPAADNRPLGALLVNPPVVREAPFDVSLRDRLYREWAKLQGDEATRDGARANALAHQLNTMLDT